MSNQVDRLGLNPAQRVIVLSGLASTYGLFHGIAGGARLASLRYLAENAHRLPRTKGTWYFFHKRKNYVILKDGINSGVRVAAKYGGVSGAFFCVEALVDSLTGSVSWISTATAGFAVGSSIVALKHLNLQQSLRSVRNFTVFAAIVGFVQDRVRTFSHQSRELRLAAAEEARTKDLEIPEKVVENK